MAKTLETPIRLTIRDINVRYAVKDVVARHKLDLEQLVEVGKRITETAKGTRATLTLDKDAVEKIMSQFHIDKSSRVYKYVSALSEIEKRLHGVGVGYDELRRIAHILTLENDMKEHDGA